MCVCGEQGYLDDQFSQLQMLQDESSPDFVEEVVTLFFDDTEKLLENLTESLYVGSDLGCGGEGIGW